MTAYPDYSRDGNPLSEGELRVFDALTAGDDTSDLRAEAKAIQKRHQRRRRVIRAGQTAGAVVAIGSALAFIGSSLQSPFETAPGPDVSRAFDQKTAGVQQVLDDASLRARLGLCASALEVEAQAREAVPGAQPPASNYFEAVDAATAAHTGCIPTADSVSVTVDGTQVTITRGAVLRYTPLNLTPSPTAS